MSESAARFGLQLDEPPLSPTPPARDPADELLSSEQMTHALAERLASGRSIAEIALAHGWVTRADLDRLEAPTVPVVSPAPPEPAPRVPERTSVFLRLSNGERLQVSTFPTNDLAMHEARLLSFRMGHEGEWPVVGTRYIRPDAVVSVDVEPAS
jgi:hypothetical protein